MNPRKARSSSLELLPQAGDWDIELLTVFGYSPSGHNVAFLLKNSYKLLICEGLVFVFLLYALCEDFLDFPC